MRRADGIRDFQSRPNKFTGDISLTDTDIITHTRHVNPHKHMPTQSCNTHACTCLHACTQTHACTAHTHTHTFPIPFLSPQACVSMDDQRETGRSPLPVLQPLSLHHQNPRNPTRDLHHQADSVAVQSCFKASEQDYLPHKWKFTLTLYYPSVSKLGDRPTKQLQVNYLTE